MSTRIIIEKDGERYVANDLTAILFEEQGWLSVENERSKFVCPSTFTRLPPVIRTDNSAKCDCKDCSFRGMELCEHRKLQAENAKLREARKKFGEWILFVESQVFVRLRAAMTKKNLRREVEETIASMVKFQDEHPTTIISGRMAK